jgi:AraC-like DNA-binding protein
VLSAKGQIESKVDLYQLGADNYLTKPFQLQELLAIADSTLKQRKKLRDSFLADYLNKPQSLEQKDVITEEASNNNVQQYIDYILEHLDSPDLNVNTMGKHFNLGRNRLQREIKIITGLTPVEFIRSVRLNEAQKILKAGKHNISEIAYMTGFSNLSYFSRSYKLQFGVAPSEVQVAALR